MFKTDFQNIYRQCLQQIREAEVNQVMQNDVHWPNFIYTGHSTLKAYDF